MSTVSRIKELAKEQGRSMSFLCQKIGYKSRTYFSDLEKNGKEVPLDKLEILAAVLNVSVDYLLGNTDQKLPFVSTPNITGKITRQEINLINAYRLNPSMQPAVDKLLGISAEDGFVDLYVAASSDNNHQDGIIRMTKEEWDKIKNTPYTDDPLM